MDKARYNELIGLTRVAIFDGIVAGKPFAKMIYGAVIDAVRLGELVSERIEDHGDIRIADLMESAAIKSLDHFPHYGDFTELRARVTTDALGKLFKGDMDGMVALITNSGIVFGFMMHRLSYSDRKADMLLANMAARAKESDSNKVDTKDGSAFFGYLDSLPAEQAVRYMRRFTLEEGLLAPLGVPEFEALMTKFRLALP